MTSTAADQILQRQSVSAMISPMRYLIGSSWFETDTATLLLAPSEATKNLRRVKFYRTQRGNYVYVAEFRHVDINNDGAFVRWSTEAKRVSIAEFAKMLLILGISADEKGIPEDVATAIRDAEV